MTSRSDWKLKRADCEKAKETVSRLLENGYATSAIYAYHSGDSDRACAQGRRSVTFVLSTTRLDKVGDDSLRSGWCSAGPTGLLRYYWLTIGQAERRRGSLARPFQQCGRRNRTTGRRTQQTELNRRIFYRQCHQSDSRTPTWNMLES